MTRSTITYRLLSSIDFIPLFDSFLEAFSDYQVDMRMSREQFEQRLVRDGVQLKISAGAFDGNRLIGFYLNAAGEWQGKQMAYDAGTGVTPNYRRQGIAEELFAFMVPRLKAASLTHYLLEVLSGNEAAVSLYRKVGFVDTRRFAVFRRKEPVTTRDDLQVRRVNRPEWELFKSFWDGYPSWQNSTAAVDRVIKQTTILGAYVDHRCVGYGVVFSPGASLMQLAVAPAYRRRGIGSSILAALQREVSATESLRVNNIDETLEGTMKFYEANGFKLVLEQYEMIKSLI